MNPNQLDKPPQDNDLTLAWDEAFLELKYQG